MSLWELVTKKHKYSLEESRLVRSLEATEFPQSSKELACAHPPIPIYHTHTHTHYTATLLGYHPSTQEAKVKNRESEGSQGVTEQDDV